MALYLGEEICEGCIEAVFHKCCHSFCRCKKTHEKDRDYIKGKCPFYFSLLDRLFDICKEIE